LRSARYPLGAGDRIGVLGPPPIIGAKYLILLGGHARNRTGCTDSQSSGKHQSVSCKTSLISGSWNQRLNGVSQHCLSPVARHAGETADARDAGER
jgi:hypothetical protein